MQTGRPPKHPRCPFGQRLNDLREEKGLTLQQVVENFGISLRAYGFWKQKQWQWLFQNPGLAPFFLGLLHF